MKKNNFSDHDFVDGAPLDRRSFLQKLTALLGGMTLIDMNGFALKEAVASVLDRNQSHKEKLIFIAVDALHPKYFDLDANGMPGGREGNWLMPHFRSFLKNSMWYPNARSFLPAATDMNHLNALAGTSSAQTGIIGVWGQPTRWDQDGEAVVSRTSMSFARDDRGRPVDTIFHAWKRRWPDSRTMFITGKEWVGEMFRESGIRSSGIDILVTGPHHAEYLHEPQPESFTAPAGRDTSCTPKSGHLGFFGKHMGASDVMTRLYTGQQSQLTWQMENFPEHFPHDRWVVDSALEIFRRENPDMAYILLAQCDDAGHAIGSAWDPAEFVNADPPYSPDPGCENKPEYQLVSSRNKMLFKEPILNIIRDVDFQFGRLIDGLKKLGIFEKAKIILLSDHSAVNHLYTDDFASTDCVGLLERAGIIAKETYAEKPDMYAFSVSSYGVLYWRENKGKISRAKAALLDHRAFNPQTGQQECPWWVLDRTDMRRGIEGVCLPGELYHTYYVDVDQERTIIWPDLIILAKNGWQIPVYNGQVPNVGIKAPRWSPPWRVYNGGHGSVDTQAIVAAFSIPGGKKGVNHKPIRIADLGVTAASLTGLTLQSTRVGKDLSRDLI